MYMYVGARDGGVQRAIGDACTVRALGGPLGVVQAWWVREG